jgi:hypothetical protein
MVEVEGNDLFVAIRSDADLSGHHLRRLEDGLEQGLSLVIAKSVLALVDLLGPEDGAAAALRVGVSFGLRNREAGWGAGLTVLTAMANVLRFLETSDRALALVHGLVFVSRDTRGRPPRFPLDPLPADVPVDRLAGWYRRFLDTRSGDGAERVLATAVKSAGAADLAGLMGAGATDHLFVDGGHTIDFTNKAFDVLDHLGWDEAPSVLTALAHQTATASRAEEAGQWRSPEDLPRIISEIQANGVRLQAGSTSFPEDRVEALAWMVLGDDPAEIVAALDASLKEGASYEQIGRAVAYAAGLRLVRFHTQNDHSDWDVIHHGFTAANATHRLVSRSPDPNLARGIYHAALKVFLDRFLNIPSARLPTNHALAKGRPDLRQLQACWDQEGMVDEAGAIVYGYLRSGGNQGAVMAALGSALLAEDAEFHWYQTYEAAVRQASVWPRGSEPAALILVGAARFVAAHTPTRRELAQVVRIATRLRRGEALYEEI